MAFRPRRLLVFTAMLVFGAVQASQASAYLFWRPPTFTGAPVKGDEPGLGLPMPKATEKEVRAHLLWNLRAGLNVAALQCQFSPALMSVRNYNDLLHQHGPELNGAYSALSGYFKRTAGKGWQTAIDQYTTRTYNGFSTLHAQLGFCETAAQVGRDALERKKGDLYVTAENRMREMRNSLVPAGDGLYSTVPSRPQVSLPTLPSLDERCWDKRDRLRKRCGGMA